MGQMLWSGTDLKNLTSAGTPTGLLPKGSSRGLSMAQPSVLRLEAGATHEA
jgi:hypothetical protein